MFMLLTPRLFSSKPPPDPSNMRQPKEPKSLFNKDLKKRRRRTRNLKSTLLTVNTSSSHNQRLLNSLGKSFKLSERLEAISTDLVTSKLKSCLICTTLSLFPSSKKLPSTDLSSMVKTELSELKPPLWCLQFLPRS
jgi:hypothetical protein